MIRTFSKRCPFSVMGLSEGVTKQEIKNKYYLLAKQFHPDMNPDFKERFQEINEAYTTLMANAPLKEDSRSQDFNREMREKEAESYKSNREKDKKDTKSSRPNQENSKRSDDIPMPEDWSYKHYIALYNIHRSMLLFTVLMPYGLFKPKNQYQVQVEIPMEDYLKEMKGELDDDLENENTLYRLETARKYGKHK